MNKTQGFFIGSESGFVSFKSNKLSLALNVFGHQQFYWNSNIIDPRLVGCVPFWMCFNEKSLIPAIPYSHGYRVSIPSKLPLSGRIYKLIDSVYRWKVNPPYIPGFLSYIRKRSSILIFQGFSKSKIKNLDKGILIMGYGPLMEIPLLSPKVLIGFLSEFKTIFNIPNKNETLIKNSGIEISKTIIISEEFLFIKECYDQNILKGSYLTPFTIRTYANVKIKQLNNFVCFISEINGFFIAVSIYKNEIVKKKKKLYSSTGEVAIWEFKNTKNIIQREITLSRIIIGGDDIRKIDEIKDINVYQEEINRMESENNDYTN